MEKIAKEIASQKNACLWFSGGKDSRLLVEIIRKYGIDIPVLRFDDGWSKEQKRQVDSVIADHDLSAYSYPATVVSLVGENDNLAFVASYAVDNRNHFALFRDVVPGERCFLDIEIPRSQRQGSPILFSTHILGSRKSDRHFIFGDAPVCPEREWTVGGVKFLAPLYDWTDGMILAALKELGVDFAYPVPEHLDTGNLVACTRCLGKEKEVYCPKRKEVIPNIEWSPEDHLAKWREMYGPA